VGQTDLREELEREYASAVLIIGAAAALCLALRSRLQTTDVEMV
jgi:hypothetical protein